MLVAALVPVPRLVPGMGLEESAGEMGERRSVDGLDEETRKVRDTDVPNHGPKALDDGNDCQGPNQGFADAVSKQEFGLGDVGVLGGHEVARNFDERRAVPGELGLPGRDRRNPGEGAWRTVGAVFVKAAVAADAVRDEGFRDRVVGKEFFGGIDRLVLHAFPLVSSAWVLTKRAE